MKLKNILILALVVALTIIPMTSFASAETLAPDYVGNTTDLIDIKNPEAATASTTNKACVISAVATDGTTVTLYKLDAATNTYTKLYTDGKALESVVGAAGLYAQNIELSYGTNSIMVVASNGNLVETVKLEITLIKSNLIDTIKNLWQNIINP